MFFYISAMLSALESENMPSLGLCMCVRVCNNAKNLITQTYTHHISFHFLLLTPPPPPRPLLQSRKSGDCRFSFLSSASMCGREKWSSISVPFSPYMSARQRIRRSSGIGDNSLPEDAARI